MCEGYDAAVVTTTILMMMLVMLAATYEVGSGTGTVTDVEEDGKHFWGCFRGGATFLAADGQENFAAIYHAVSFTSCKDKLLAALGPRPWGLQAGVRVFRGSIPREEEQQEDRHARDRSAIVP